MNINYYMIATVNDDVIMSKYMEVINCLDMYALKWEFVSITYV